ncbi:MAG: endonuclease/exonuclease/phosphatase family protein [Planctomycetaceae bacterium]|nr:endonuclease/exonuclease/phosphatase family protein [Planctomycetaceae bacterium]
MTAAISPSSPNQTPPSRRSLAWSLVLSAIIATVWIGSQRVSMGPAVGNALAGKAPVATVPTAEKWRLGTFNIHSGKGRDGQLNLSRIADCVRGADFVALNEVRNDFPSGESNQAEWLAHELQQRWLYAPTEERWWGQLFGNAVVTRFAVDGWQRLPLVRQTSKSFRNATLLGLNAGARRVHVLVTHLERASDADRVAQFYGVMHWFLALEPPVVLLGDLNTTRDAPEMQSLLAKPGVIDALAQLETDPPRRIDWILVRGLNVLAAGSDDRGASDHPYYWADVQLP